MEQSKKNTIMIYSTMKKTKEGKPFRAYWTKMKIVVAGEEEKGKQLKNINVSFRKEVNTYDIGDPRNPWGGGGVKMLMC